MAIFSNNQIDRLGNRLRGGTLTESDLRMLDDYRRSFGEAYEIVIAAIREQLLLQPTGRPAKSTGSIVEKLHRESIRMVQIQDIAGCRIVVADIREQDGVVASLLKAFPQAVIVDRRAAPSYGYRAVHVIVRIFAKSVEIQVRTLLQHLWAELSEKLADVIHPEIKYGGGPEVIKGILDSSSDVVARLEGAELEMIPLERRLAAIPEPRKEELTPKLEAVRARLAGTRKTLREGFDHFIAAIEQAEAEMKKDQAK